jgi:hypothetical protein
MTEVLIERGPRWTWASALDHPGWCRRAKGEEAAVEELLAYADRYAKVVPGFRPGRVKVVDRVDGPASNDFAPMVAGPGEERRPTPKQLAALEGCWVAFDAAVVSASAQLRKGPRGGGRDRDQIVDHVVEAERAYGRQIGVRVPPRTPWPEQRDAVLTGLRTTKDAKWLPRYALRRVAWHVLDHAWELEDKTL